MRRLVTALALLAVPALAPGYAAAAPTDADAGSGALTVTVAVGGRPITDGTLTVDPDRQLPLLITAANNGQSAQRVHTIRFDGAVLGLSFFGYDTTVPFDVAPHESATRTLVLDLGDLRGQAIGLLPASVELLDEGGNPLGGVDTVADVRGSIVSLYGALGLVLLVFAAAAWASAVRAVLVRRDRPETRWRRVARFLPAGIGTGLVAVVWLSVFRLVAPELVTALGIVLGGVVVGLVAASVAARPEDDETTDEALTTIIDPTVGAKAGVLDAAPDKEEPEHAAHSGDLADADVDEAADSDDTEDEAVEQEEREESTKA